MIRTIDVLYAGKSFVLAFRSEEDANRFIAFMQEHEMECPTLRAEGVYRLDPQWSMGQYMHVPKYAVHAIDPKAVLRMVTELIDARVPGGEERPKWPSITIKPSKEKGIGFAIQDMPPIRPRELH